jgi:glycosyltransferase involved in cell wall biosynthesis
MVLLDGDGQHDPAEIPQLLAPVLDGEADLTIGVRKRSTSRIPVHRRFGQRVLDFLTAYGSLDALTDSQSGFRALSRTAINSLHLEERSFSIESEMLIDAKEKHLRVAEVPIRARYDVEGSTKGPLSHGFGVIDRLLRIIAVRHPLLFFAVPGLILFLLGLWMGYDTLDTYNATHFFAIGKALLTIIFLLLGALAVFAGLILNTMPRAIVRILEGRAAAAVKGREK